ncbi:MAG: NosD domain-containing protein [Methanomassiliicoccales archaeon]
MVWYASHYGWPGDGSSGHPYLIEGLILRTSTDVPCIYIGNTTYNIGISNCSLAGKNEYIIDSGNFITGRGIALFNLQNVSVERCAIYNCSIGISLLSCSHIKVSNFSANDFLIDYAAVTTEIMLNRSNYVTITDSVLLGGTSYRLDNSSHNIIRNNIGNALAAFFSDDNHVYNNSINRRGGSFYMLSCNSNLVGENDIGALYNPITTINTTGNVFRNNTIHSIHDEASFKRVDQMLFENNSVSEFDRGAAMIVESASNCSFINNYFDAPVSISDPYSTRIEGNWFNCSSNAPGSTLSLSSGGQNIVWGNTITGGNNSLRLVDSQNNIVSSNIISNADSHGILLERSINNTIISNQISGSNQAWYYNTHIQGYDDSGTNHWNDTIGGNYWSDWTGTSADEPYLLDGGRGAADFHPLKVPPLSIRYLGPTQ